jgi:hypothetical protein
MLILLLCRLCHQRTMLSYLATWICTFLRLRVCFVVIIRVGLTCSDHVSLAHVHFAGV